MNILALQTGQYEHFSSAVEQAVVRYPDARLTGLIKADDLERARISKLFKEIIQIQDDGPLRTLYKLGVTSFDYCLVPFEDRFGIQYWTFRSIPIRLGIHHIGSYNRLHRFKEAPLAIWILESLFVNTVARAIVLVMCFGKRVWWRLRRNLSIAVLFVLAGLALLLRGLASLGLHPVKWVIEKRLPTGRRRVVLHIPSLGLGGAQRQLAIFLERIDRSLWDVEVVTVDALDKFFEPTIREQNITIHYLNPHCQLYEVGLVWQLVRYLYRRPCHVLHSWLHFSVAIGAVAGTLVGIARIIGSIRSEQPARFPWFFPPWQRAIDIVTAPLQTVIIANSNAVRHENQQWAFLPERKMVTIYNGINVQDIRPLLPEQERQLREELHLPQGTPVVGIVGRLSPEKDHITFLRAARFVIDVMPTAVFVVVGGGPLHDAIRAEIAALGLEGCVVMTGERRDVLYLIQLMDILVLTSTSEGLPNVLLEAAVCGVPTVTCAAGGASEVVVHGETGFVVPCKDPRSVADRVLDLIRDRALRQKFIDAAKARTRILFSAERFAASVEGCYCEQYGRTYQQDNKRKNTHVAVEHPHD
ncbi:membrane protein of unknown function [Nitrospira tepida]|uniref:Glycosyltransferase n=1 Tax=Nitrospira tepida TaxID=2973512 RepID=A0AA86T7S8_9BACT|nr:glycosyltransferase [Nitrospira tepida]CAI4033182.1 membrane protein of unknown function [Nitrospira tepida]